ncbi:unnamed protein product [Didymodactylos carnosus]|uniref:ABC transporter domain-containing protein n=1 Tax=Didymodactylos carnosus TaxID=1234261 RepID=A0A815X272_9BILA|nr:unnamed protein product [Didymodactylos carnosus]CAF4412509.1 unnamed protein product [Didymodactylos carnosus]
MFSSLPEAGSNRDGYPKSTFSNMISVENYQSSDKLSDGEKQRVAVARALISKCKVLSGDEVTSALDNQTERNLLVTLQKAKVELGLTIVVIAHRLSTVINADNIVCMEHGRGIVEQGTHAQLIENNGLYKQFYMAQKMKETLHQGPTNEKSTCRRSRYRHIECKMGRRISHAVEGGTESYAEIFGSF